MGRNQRCNDDDDDCSSLFILLTATNETICSCSIQCIVRRNTSEEHERVAAHANRMTFLTFNCDGMVLINDFISSALLSAVDELVLARFSTENGNVSLCTYRGVAHSICIVFSRTLEIHFSHSIRFSIVSFCNLLFVSP